MKGKILALIGLYGLSAISVNATPNGIYWSDIGTGTIEYIGFDGSGRTTLVSGLSNPQGLDVTDSYLYWTDRDDLLIRRANPDGTNAQGILNTFPGVPRDLYVNEQYIYWTNTGVDSISRVEIDGANPVDLVTTGLGFPNGIYLTDSFIYWSDSGTTSIKRSSLIGTDIVEVISGLLTTHLPNDVFVTTEHIYWSTRDLCLTRPCEAVPGTIQRSNLDGTNVVKLIDGLVFPQDIVVTHHYIYWTDQYSGKIQRSNIDGTNVIDLVVGLTTPNGLSVVPLNIAVDIKPDWKTDINEIDLKRDRNLKVAALTGGEFDAVSQIDPATVSFGPFSASPRTYQVKDADRDGDYDLIFIFDLEDTGISCGDTESILQGETYSGTLIEGRDLFTVIPCSYRE